MNCNRHPSNANKTTDAQLAAEETTGRSRQAGDTYRPRHIWLTLEGSDIIELKQVMLDRDADGAAAFFRRAVLPQVRESARRHNITVEQEDNGRLSG